MRLILKQMPPQDNALPCSPTPGCDTNIMTPLERSAPFNEWSWEMNIFGMWGLLLSLSVLPVLEKQQLPNENLLDSVHSIVEG